jgi:hypothetical protein
MIFNVKMSGKYCFDKIADEVKDMFVILFIIPVNGLQRTLLLVTYMENCKVRFSKLIQ